MASESFPGGSRGKESACNAGDLVQFLGREDPLEKRMATPSVFLPGESYGQRSLAGYSPRGRNGSNTSEQLTYIGDGTVSARLELEGGSVTLGSPGLQLSLGIMCPLSSAAAAVRLGRQPPGASPGASSASSCRLGLEDGTGQGPGFGEDGSSQRLWSPESAPGSELSALHTGTHSSLTAARKWEWSHCTDDETEAGDRLVVTMILGGDLNPGPHR